jgi:hypothetical protein
MRACWPSEQFPGPPHVALEAPDGWETAYRAGAVLALQELTDEATVPALVTVHVERQATTTTARQVADALASRTTEAVDDLVVLGDEPARFGDLPGIVRLQSFTPPGGLPVFQAQCIVVAVDAAHTATDLVLLHATCTIDRAESCSPAFRHVVDSLTVGREDRS